MAQSDQVVQNATFPTVRADINDNLAALYSQSSGPSDPTEAGFQTVAFQPWVDTSSSPPVWKIRNSANTGWITVGVLDPAGFESGGVTPIANGGTGQITAAAAIAALLPSQGGNANKALITTGTSLLWGNAISSTFTKYETPGTFTWTKPAGVTTVIVFCWGGGGAGGRHNAHSGSGGAGASCVIGILAAVDLSSSETITVGAGGVGSGSNSFGQSGANSSFGSHVTGYGGLGGFENNSNRADYADGSRAWGIGGYESGLFGFDYDVDARDIFSGGAGGSLSTRGGNAVFGGAGGGGGPLSGSAVSGGTSVFGGNGGAGVNNGSAGSGSQPGGGGGGTENGVAGSGGDGAVWVITL
jgi:hypothetical protein